MTPPDASGAPPGVQGPVYGPPSTTTPSVVTLAPGLQGPVGVPSSSADPIPADLNGTWRGLMNSLGVGLPHHLNRAARVVNLGHTWAR